MSLPSGVVDREQLEAGDLLGGAALVVVDVRGPGRDDRAPAGQHAGERDDVRAGAVEDRERLGLRAEVLAHDLLQALGVDVLAVGDLVAVVRGGDRGEHLGVHAGVVVAREAAGVRVVQWGHRSILRVDCWAAAAPHLRASASRHGTRAPSLSSEFS